MKNNLRGEIMISKKVVYEKQLVRKKMLSLIIYGIIFLVSTIAFYFVNTSKAKNVVKVRAYIIDQNTDIGVLSYDLKAQEEDGKYKAALYPIQNGFIVKKYKLATEKEFEELKKTYDEKHKDEIVNKKEQNNSDDKDSKEEKNEVSENIAQSKEKKEDDKKEKQKDEEKDNKEKIDEIEESKDSELSKEEQEKKEEEERKIRELIKNSKEIELTEEQIENQKMYFIAEYDVKEAKDKKIYNNIISKTTNKASINILGYMPEKAELSLKEKDLEEVTNILKNNFQDVNREIKLIAAYDIKILSEEKEYEPEDFDEKASVSIKGFEGQKINVWHIKNDNSIEMMDLNENSDIVYETTHIEDQLGVRISISSGSDVLTSAQLEGIYITYKGNNYFPRSDGSYRIKIADAVSNVIADMTLNTENGNLETGTYTITAQSFGSIDGTYFSSQIAADSKDIQVVSTDYGFLVSLDDLSVLIDKATGKNQNNTNALNFGIEYSGRFEHPKIAVALYRRKYDRIYSYDYELVDLRNYINHALSSTGRENEYLVTDLVRATQNFTLTLKNGNLRTGTYKIRFTLYDGNNRICDMDKVVIIK